MRSAAGVMIVLFCLFATRAAHAVERLAVLELQAPSLSAEERGLLTDTVRGAVVDALPPDVKVMTRENMEVMLTDMGLDASCVAEGACEVETARNLGVDYVVSGNVVSISNVLVVSLKLHETGSGALVASKQQRGADVLTLMDGLAAPSQELLAKLPNNPSPASRTTRTTRATSSPIREQLLAPLRSLDLNSELQRLAQQKRLQSIQRLAPLTERAKPSQRAEMMLRTADLYLEEGRYILATELARSPNDHTESSKWLSGAERLYAEIRRSYPTYNRQDQVLYELGVTKALLGKEDEALVMFQALIRDHPGSFFVTEAKQLIAK